MGAARGPFSLENAKLHAPRGLPSDFPRVLVFDANPMRPALIRTKVDGAVFSRSLQRRPATAATLKDHANSLSARSLLESETRSSQSFNTDAGISAACFRRRWWVLSHVLPRRPTFENPNRLDNLDQRWLKISGWPLRARLGLILVPVLLLFPNGGTFVFLRVCRIRP